MDTHSIIKQENVDFSVNPAIIKDLIFSQSGTLSKAITELIMNAIDAGTSHCEIQLNRTSFTLVDWGCGFQSEEYIKTYFKTFGEPHKENDVMFGRFRIGRGQIMAFGQITWTSHQYSMTVDIEKKGLNFDFLQHEGNQWAGCRVTGQFYEPLTLHELELVKTQLKEYVSFTSVDVFLNNEKLNDNLTEENWDIDDSEITVKWHKGIGIKLYNQGIFVKEFPTYYGFDAIIMTKKNLSLNMARNEIKDTDPLIHKIYGLLNKKSQELAKRKGFSSRLDAKTRRSLIWLFLFGKLPSKDVLNACFFKECRGHSLSIKNIINNPLAVTLSPERDSKKAEIVAMRRLALVLDQDVLDEFNVKTLSQLAKKVQHTITRFYPNDNELLKTIRAFTQKEHIDFNIISKDLIDDPNIVPPRKYTPQERAAKNAVQTGAIRLAQGLSHYFNREIKPRRILLANDFLADGRTNGTDTILVSTQMTSLLEKKGRDGAYQLALLLLHEYLHDSNDHDFHKHDINFMNSFHDIVSDYQLNIVGATSHRIYYRYLQLVAHQNRPFPKKTKQDFTLPFINKGITYEITVKDNRVPPFLRKLIALMDLTCQKKKGTLVVTCIKQFYHPLYSAYLKKLLKKAKYIQPFNLDESIIATEIQKFLGKNDISHEACLHLLKSFTLEHVFNYLLDENLGNILAVITEHPIPIRRIRSKAWMYDHHINCLSIKNIPCRPKEIARMEVYTLTEPKERLAYIEKVMGYLLSGLKQKEEQEAVANYLFTPEAKERIFQYVN